MNTVFYPLKETWEDLCKRPVMDSSELNAAVLEILEKVRSEGDKALHDYSEKFDRVTLTGIKVTQTELYESAALIQSDLKTAINIANQNIEKFHKSQLVSEEVIETVPGVKCWRKNVPIEKVGLYVPGGTAPLFSTVLMLGVPAKVAGCSQIILCTPPDKNGNVNPLILYAAALTGITDIFKIGGAQAIVAMAYGTETVPKVSKIFGPGNQYVTKAKEMVQSDGVAIDMPAGPSEVLIIADSTADPAFVAADLLSQAEHGVDSQVVLLTDNMELLLSAMDELTRQLETLPRKETAAGSLENSHSIVLPNLDDCIDFSNRFAPEHLIINTSEPAELAGKVVNAGSVFIGKYSCESAGDYASGTNHTLPTNGFARSYSGVSTESFVRKITFQEISREGLENIATSIELMAEAENLSGHKNAVSVRLKKSEDV
jgi:histidinol dehydrogenase